MRPFFAAVALIFALTPAFAATTATVSTSSVLHAGPAARFPAVGTIGRDRQVTVKGCSKSGRWCEIESNGKDGWVLASHLASVNAASEPTEKGRSTPSANADTPSINVTTPAAAPTSVDTAKGLPASQIVTITIKSADGKVSSKMTVAAGSTVVVTASGRSRCELKVAVNP